MFSKASERHKHNTRQCSTTVTILCELLSNKAKDYDI